MKIGHLITALIGVIALTLTTQAQGIIIPRPCPRPIVRCPQPLEVPQRPLKVKSIRFNTKITDQVAVTHVEQVFENDTPYMLEGVYFFPLPDNVSITEFAMWDGDKRLVGEVRSRDEARRIYDDIVRSRRDPALLEYAGKNLFQASVFPIPPHSDKKIELTYSQVLRNESGTVAYRYPLGTGWQSQGFWAQPPRPAPRREIEPERPQSRPGGSSFGRISAVVEISSSAEIKGIYSPSHEIDVKRDGERKARLSFESGSGASADFQLFYTLSNQDFGLSLLTYREPGKDGFFLLLVSPKAELDEREVSSKEVIFVLDTSGSMAEEGKMDKAKAALRHGVGSLNPRDRFNIVSFAGEEHLMSERLITADEGGKKQAREFIERMRPTGGTNINDALMAAFKQIQPGERPQMVVLITDGQPTVGETKAGRILANVKQANKANTRLFTFGVGYDVNTVLLDGLAGENRGTVAYIEPKEDIEIKVSDFFAKVNNPVLSDVKIDWGGAETDLVYPRATPDVFHGSQLVLVGRYRPQGSAKQLTLTGKVNSRERRFVYDDLEFPEKRSDNEFLPHLWAMRRVGHLLDQIRLNGESKELRDEIVDLGTRYGIVTPYTSYLVLEPEMRMVAGQSRNSSVAGGAINPSLRRREAPREDAAPAPTNKPLQGRSSVAQTVTIDGVAGKDAVEFSKKKAELGRADKLASPPSSANQIRQVAGKTFYLLNGVWTDSEFKEDDKLPVVTLKFAGDDYFNLISQEPKLAECFALGQRVVVVWKGKVYRVEE
ncbi:MAG TPA: VIT and VWA domain-containing protein [Blastocatellia bacterium]|nr:VIT and VWA domain-containing protein [Blastocatellia bacterium]